MSFLETPRLLIRKWDVERDLDDALEIYGDPETMHFIPCGSLARDRTRALIARMAARDEAEGFGIWPVVLREERKVIGECGISEIPGYPGDIEIAWIFNRNYHGTGYALEAASAVKALAFEQAKVSELYALIDRENARSIRLANRLDMEFDRIIRAYARDLMRYRTRLS